MQILFDEVFGRVDDDDGDVGRVDRGQRFNDREFLDDVVDLAFASNAGGIDQYKPADVVVERDFDRVARCTRCIEDHLAFFAEPAVDQRRLADVRPPDHRDTHPLFFVRRDRFRRRGQLREHSCLQCGDAAPVRGGYRYLRKTEAAEFGIRRFGRHAVDLVDDEHDRTTAAPQLLRDVEVGGRQSGAAVDDKEHEVGFVDRNGCLLRHQTADGRLVEQAAGIDQRAVCVAELGDPVPAIAREARRVGDQRVAAPRQPVE